MSENDLSKSKIININDFIFKQNLEFYPNLNELSCEDNILTYKEDGHVIAGETLTFDLRTLPGKVWNMNPVEFIDVIKLNKDCLGLVGTSDYINEHIYDNFMNPAQNDGMMNDFEKIKNQTEVYFKGANNLDLLCDSAAQAVGYYGNNVIKLHDDGRFPQGMISEAIAAGTSNYLSQHPNQNEQIVLERTRKLIPINEEKYPIVERKAGFINIAIALYGIFNIGLIVAMAIMK